MRSTGAMWAVALAAALGGCVQTAPDAEIAAEKWGSDRKKMAESVRFRKEKTEECSSYVRKDKELTENFLVIIDMPKEKAIDIGCERIITAIVNGRFDYKLYNYMRTGNKSPEYVKILQGR